MAKGPEKQKSAPVGLSAQDRKFLEGLKKFYAQAGPRGERFAEFVIEQDRLMTLTIAELKRIQKKNRFLYSQIAKWIQFDHQTFLDAIRGPVTETNPDIPEEEFDAGKTMVTPVSLALSGLSTNESFDMRAGLIGWLEDKPDGKEFQELLRAYQALFPKLPPGKASP